MKKCKTKNLTPILTRCDLFASVEVPMTEEASVDCFPIYFQSHMYCKSTVKDRVTESEKDIIKEMCRKSHKHKSLPSIGNKRKKKKQMDRVKRIWYLSHMRAAKIQASLRIRAVSPEPPLLAHTSSESRGTFRQKTRSLVPLNGWTCAVEICHDGMLEDTNSLDGAQIMAYIINVTK